MKKIIFTLCVFAVSTLFAQTGNLVIFSSGGQPFYLYLNGELQNNQPLNSVKVEDSPEGYYSAELKFFDATVGEFKKDVTIMAGATHTYKAAFFKKEKTTDIVRINAGTTTTTTQQNGAEVEVVKPKGYKHGYWKLIANSESVIDGYIGKSSALNFGNFLMSTNNVNTTQNTTVSTNVVTDPVVTNTSNNTSTNVSSNSSGSNKTGTGINMNMNGTSINLNLNGASLENDDMTGFPNGQVPTTTTTTNSYSPTTTVVQDDYSGGSTIPGNTVITNSSYSNPCLNAATTGDMESGKRSISSKSFEDTKLSTAKQFTGSHCLNTSQIKEIMKLFAFEESKIDFAKYAYDHCTDQNNYYKVNDAFTFDGSIQTLQEYIDSKK